MRFSDLRRAVRTFRHAREYILVALLTVFGQSVHAHSARRFASPVAGLQFLAGLGAMPVVLEFTVPAGGSVIVDLR